MNNNLVRTLVFSLIIATLCTLPSVQTIAQTIPDVLNAEKSTGICKSSDEEYPQTCGHIAAAMQEILATHPSAIQRQPYDVLRYDVYMDWRKPLTDTGEQARRYWGYNRIAMRIDSPSVQRILLNARSLRIDSVFLGTQRLSGIVQPNGDVFRLDLPKAMKSGDTFTLSIYYTQQRLQNGGGFYNYKHGSADNNSQDTAAENIAYTMSQPNDARGWMPCNDNPYDKAYASITVRVPKDYVVCSNGLLRNTKQESDGSLTYSWSDDAPIPSYLMVAIASKLVAHTEWYKRRDNPNDSLPVPLYLWERDYELFKDNVIWAQKSTVQMMNVFSELYGEYPFSSKYGQVLLYPYFSGGMEHQTMTTNHRKSITNRWEGVIAHELMHQWTGDNVTCATWFDIWLNEGGATYGEVLWIEHNNGWKAAQDYMAQRRDRDYMRNDGAASQPAVYGIDLSNLFNGGTTYVKGGWVYHMLRRLVGDSAYFSMIREYMTSYAKKSVETEDLVRFLEEHYANPPIPFRTFFDQWIYERGHPVYGADVLSIEATGNGEYDVQLRFRQSQTQPNFLNVYQMPVTLTFISDTTAQARRFDYTFLNNQREQLLTVHIPFLARRALIDDNGNILCQKETNSVVVSVEDESGDAAHQLHVQLQPNPIPEGGDIGVEYTIPTTGMVRIELLDVLGNSLRVLHNGMMPEGRYSFSASSAGLARGIYFVRTSVGDKILVVKMVIGE